MPRRLAGEAPYCTLNHLHSRNHPHFSTELQQMNRVLNHRQKKGDTAVSPWRPLCFLSELITNEPADFYVLPNARDHLATQLINRLIRVFDKGLFKQHHLFQPLVQLALGDLLKRLLAVHHARPGLVPELFHILGTNTHIYSCIGDSSPPASTSPTSPAFSLDSSSVVDSSWGETVSASPETSTSGSASAASPESSLWAS